MRSTTRRRVALRYPTGRALLGLVSLTSLLFAAWPRPAPAQTPGDLVVAGRVTDSSSGAAIRGALVVLGERGPRAIADSTGAFHLIGVAAGRQRVTVSRFGYATLDLEVEISAATVLTLTMQPAPIDLPGVAVRGDTEVSLVGVVRNAVTGAPIPWTSLFLSPDAVRSEARGATDIDGVFELDGVPTGRYLLRVQQVGYFGQYVPVTVDAPPEPVEIRLQPDPIVQRGLVTFTRDTRSRRNAYLGIAVEYDAEDLNMSGVADVQTFLNYFTWARMAHCEAPEDIGLTCVIGRRGEPVVPRVYIDELPIPDGLEVLRSYGPSEFYSIEVFGTATIRAYTHRFVEQRARRPRLLIPDP
jgi:hypothetical protein